MDILKMIYQHSELLMAAVIAAMILLGKGKEFLALLDEIDAVLVSCDKIMKSEPDLKNETAKRFVADGLAQATRLTKEQAKQIIDIKPDGNIALNKTAVAKQIMTSGDFKKAMRKFGKYIKKIF